MVVDVEGWTDDGVDLAAAASLCFEAAVSTRTKSSLDPISSPCFRVDKNAYRVILISWNSGPSIYSPGGRRLERKTATHTSPI